MKTMATLIPAISFALFFLYSNLLIVQAIVLAPKVLDTDGDALKVGAPYVISSVNYGGGSAGLSFNPNTFCPFRVVQRSFTASSPPEIPVTLSYPPINSNSDDVIRTIYGINIKANYFPICGSTVWRVNTDGFITTGGAADKSDSIFHLEAVDTKRHAYKIVHGDAGATVVDSDEEGVYLWKVDKSKEPYAIQFEKSGWGKGVLHQVV